MLLIYLISKYETEKNTSTTKILDAIEELRIDFKTDLKTLETSVKTDIEGIKEDVKKVKQDIKNLKIHIDIHFATKQNLEASELRTDEKAQKHRDKVLTGIAGVMKKIEGMREDRTLGNHQQAEFNKQVDKRFRRLEHTHATA